MIIRGEERINRLSRLILSSPLIQKICHSERSEEPVVVKQNILLNDKARDVHSKAGWAHRQALLRPEIPLVQVNFPDKRLLEYRNNVLKQICVLSKVKNDTYHFGGRYVPAEWMMPIIFINDRHHFKVENVENQGRNPGGFTGHFQMQRFSVGS